MKSITLTLGCLLLLATSQAETSYKLADAVQKKLVSVQFSGAKEDTAHMMTSSHYGPCMSMEIVNASADDMTLNLDYGYMLMPDDTGIQAMMVTQTLIVKLQPKAKKNYRLYAMCTEATDGSPSSAQPFKLGKRTSGNLLGLAELLNRKKYQNDAAQDAVWCLTNNHDVTSIFSTDTTMMYELRRFVAKAKNIPLSKIYEAVPDYSAPVQTRVITYTYSGSISYSLINTGKIMIALFDEDNHMKKVYVNNETQREGQYTYNYQISSTEMENKKHYLRMFRDGKMEEEIAILPRD
ncbi:MAG: hypothetical protein U0T75_00680 [Chitinophagales bacterium]